MKIRELREKEIGELEKILAEKTESVRKARFDVATKQVKNSRAARNDRKDIARILTLLKERQ
ncbi:MAG TPA: 50S ribosomal protein L29 [Patescibacteria group bacterium]|nr:50S ribosomal protein L29 [Patescibacteria group bacterium]